MNTLAACIRQLVKNRTKYAHMLAGAAAAVSTLWATDQAFRTAMTGYLMHMPHWTQAAVGLATFLIPLYKTFRKFQDAPAPAEEN